MSKKLQVLADPVVVNFFRNEIFFIFKKITTTGSTNTCVYFTFDLGSFNWIYKEIRQEVVNEWYIWVIGPWKAFALVLADWQISM